MGIDHLTADRSTGMTSVRTELAANDRPATTSTALGQRGTVTVVGERIGRRGMLIAIILGAFLLTLGIVLPLYAYPKLAVNPLDPETISISSGQASTLFDRENLVQRRNVDLTATVSVRGDLGAPEARIGGNVAVWLAGIVVADSENRVVSTTEQRVCIDRHSGQAVADCTDQFVSNDGRLDTQVRQSGIILKFPFDTQRRDYDFFDSATKTVAPMRFAGTDVINGLPVYRFVQSIAPTKVEDLAVPGSMVNAPDQPSVEAGRYYQNSRAVWVEPVSGVLIRDQQAVRQVVRGPDGRDGTVVFEGTLTSTPDTVRRAVAVATDAKSQLRLISGTVPMVVSAIGLLLLAVGLAAAVRRRRTAGGLVTRAGR